MKKLFLLFLTVFSFSFYSCELFEEETVNACSYEAAYNEYIDALNNFSRNATRSTCNNLKNKAKAYISKAGQCGGVDTSTAQSYIDSIDCSDF